MEPQPEPNTETRTPCSCCKGELTFEEAQFVKGKLTGARSEANPKPRKFDMLDEAFELIESLRAELFKSRAETQKALAEKEKAES